MTDRPLLLFDSGVGGLSVLAHIRNVLPKASIIYCADNGGYPYGTKTEAELAARVPALLERLVARFDPCMVVIPCNTASVIALADVRAVVKLPVVGTVPAIKPAAAITKTKVIGVLGTQATVRQKYVDDLVAEFASDCKVLRHGSAALVDLAERKLRGETPPPDAFRTALAGLMAQPHADQMDTVVLACTHFPLIQDELTKAMPHPVVWVDSGAGIARRVAHLAAHVVWTVPASGVAVFTAHIQDVDALKPALHGYGLSDIKYL